VRTNAQVGLVAEERLGSVMVSAGLEGAALPSVLRIVFAAHDPRDPLPLMKVHVS
jgi:hypothetical protein